MLCHVTGPLDELGETTLFSFTAPTLITLVKPPALPCWSGLIHGGGQSPGVRTLSGAGFVVWLPSLPAATTATTPDCNKFVKVWRNNALFSSGFSLPTERLKMSAPNSAAF